MAWPTRTGLTTAKRYARLLRIILQKYRELYNEILTVEQREIVDDLIACIQIFEDDVPQYDPS